MEPEMAGVVAAIKAAKGWPRRRPSHDVVVADLDGDKVLHPLTGVINCSVELTTDWPWHMGFCRHWCQRRRITFGTGKGCWRTRPCGDGGNADAHSDSGQRLPDWVEFSAHTERGISGFSPRSRSSFSAVPAARSLMAIRNLMDGASGTRGRPARQRRAAASAATPPASSGSGCVHAADRSPAGAPSCSGA